MKYKFNKEELEAIVSRCESKADFCRETGVKPAGGNYRVVDRLIKRYNLDISHFRTGPWNKGRKVVGTPKYTDDEVFVQNSPVRNTGNIKRRLLQHGIRENKCEICGYEHNVELHHINGDWSDNRLENLQLLCPNCHAKTPNFRAGKGQIHLAAKDLVITEEEVAQRYYERLARRRVPNKKIPEPKYGICPHCGKQFKVRHDQIYCSMDCYNAVRSETRPSFLELIKSFKQYKSFLQVGKHYGVSDNAVRKWCRLYKIPDSSKGIKAFLNELNSL